jgi:hypothetical protein
MNVGALFVERKHVRSECRLLRRALREEWPIEDSTASVIIGRLGALLKAGGLSSREALAISETLLAMEAEGLRRARADSASYGSPPIS